MPAPPKPRFALAEMERLNAEALAALTERHNVQLKSFPRDVVDGGAHGRRPTCWPSSPAAARCRAQGARQLCGVPRAHRGVVARLDQGGAGGEGGGAPLLAAGRNHMPHPVMRLPCGAVARFATDRALPGGQ